jgi:hypothetical protein
MAGLDPAIHDLMASKEDVGTRVKPGHDGGEKLGINIQRPQVGRIEGGKGP